MTDLTCQVLVVGGGPGGYATAIRAGQLGLRTVLVEADAIGGTCLNVGCIPSKALLHVADEFQRVACAAAGDSRFGIHATAPRIELAATVAWKDEVVDRLTSGVGSLLERAGVTRLDGWATVRDGKTVSVETVDGSVQVTADNLVLATGSRPVELPGLPFSEHVVSSTGALSLTEVPTRLLVVGGGYIGLELGTAYAKLGSQVVVAELEGRILSTYDEQLTRPLTRQLTDIGVELRTSTAVVGYDPDTRKARLASTDGHEEEISADTVLVAVGRAPLVDGWGLETLGLTRQGPFVAIDDRCRTSMRGVFAVGDLTGEPMLAHRAIAQGQLVAEHIAGEPRRWDKVSVPAVIFTDPEIVTVGLSPDRAREAGERIVVGLSPFTANGRAMTTEHTTGFVRVVAREDDHVLLGVQAVGEGISELSAAAALALEMAARLEDVAATVHDHPTRSEALQEAAMAALGRALHT